jgi:hypothetical protein
MASTPVTPRRQTHGWPDGNCHANLESLAYASPDGQDSQRAVT